MTTAYTSLLGLALPVTGELSGTWGDTVNNSITSLLDTSVAGTTNVSTDTDVTLTTTTGAANTARQAILLFSGARTALRTVTAPAQSKVYTVINATTGGFSVKLVGAGPTTGVTIVAGESAVCAWNGSDFVKVSNTGGSASFVNLTASGTVTFTGLSASQAVFTNASDELVSNAITGTGNVVMSASPTLTGTIGAASLTLSTDLTLSGGTANGVAYLNGSKVVTSGSALTFDGANIIVNATTPAYFTGTSNLAQVSINRSPSTGAIFNASQSAAYLNIDGASGGSSFQFVVASAANTQPSEAMRLTSTGLGIGTSSPAQTLHVKTSTALTPITLGVLSNANTLPALSFNGAYASTTMAGTYSLTGSLYTTVPSGAAQYFSIADAIKLTLDSSGNLGLGVTPSAWASGKAFEFGQTGNALWGFGTGDIKLTSNAYYNGAYRYGGSSVAAGMYNIQSGAHQWYNAPSGTAGNAISFTQAMTLDASGRLIVGATSASGSNQVEIQTGLTNGLWVQTGGVTSASTIADFRNGSNTPVLTLYGNNTSYFSGSVGIGITSPTFQLSLSSNATFWESGLKTVITGGDQELQIRSEAPGGGGRTGSIGLYTNNSLRATLNPSGNLGLGVTPSAWGSGYKAIDVISIGASFAGSNYAAYVTSNAYNNGTNWIYKADTFGAAYYNQFNGGHFWFSAPAGTAGNAITFTQAMILNAGGEFYVGATSLGSDANYFAFSPGNALADFGHGTGVASGISYTRFLYGGGVIGSITQSGTTAVAYNTSSDYRLKNITGPITTSGAYIDSLNPVEGTWKADGSAFVGLIAHEVQEASRTNVATGTKDGEQMQSMDYSSPELIANLIAEIKSLRKRLADAGIA